MYEISGPLSAPYASICYIRCDWLDGTSTRASGVVVGVNDVLTALHVVFDLEHGGWAMRITIVPGADTVPFLTKPFGEFTDIASLSSPSTNWDFDGDGLLTPDESRGDMALIGLQSRIGDTAGWLPVSQVPNDFSGVIAGYPAAGTGLMAENITSKAIFQDNVYSISYGLGPGSSGGPLLSTVDGVTSVTGVLSSGDTLLSHSTYSALFDSSNWSWLQSALVSNDALLKPQGANPDGSIGQVYAGSALAEAFTGTAGRDRFVGDGGNDWINGERGVDIAVYSGAITDYTLSLSADLFKVQDLVPLRDGTDILRGIERIQFNDLSLAFDVTGSAGQAYRLYQAVFNRAPDLAGLGYQMKVLDDGWALVQVAQNFIQSPEFVRTYGALNDGQFVSQLYWNVLHRLPDDDGYVYHTSRLASGLVSRADVILGFSESPELQLALVGVTQNGMPYLP